jgi:hypothetical protein
MALAVWFLPDRPLGGQPTRLKGQLDLHWLRRRGAMLNSKGEITLAVQIQVAIAPGRGSLRSPAALGLCGRAPATLFDVVHSKTAPP